MRDDYFAPNVTDTSIAKESTTESQENRTFGPYGIAHEFIHYGTSITCDSLARRANRSYRHGHQGVYSTLGTVSRVSKLRISEFRHGGHFRCS